MSSTHNPHVVLVDVSVDVDVHVHVYVHIKHVNVFHIVAGSLLQFPSRQFRSLVQSVIV